MSVWNAEHDQFIRDNRGALSAEQIAKKINDLFGWAITRNSVIGRSHRLGLPNIKPVPKPKLPKAPRIAGEYKARKAPTKQFISPPVPVEPMNVLFSDLHPFHCREIVGQDGFESLSCGHPKIENSSYCRWHHAVNYTTPVARSRPYYRV